MTYHMRSILSIRGPTVESRPSNSTCFMWAIVGFLLGVLVGSSLPYFVSNDNSVKRERLVNGNRLDSVVAHTGTSIEVSPHSWSLLQDSTAGSLFQSGLQSKHELIENKIFFGAIIEEALPNGFSDFDDNEWRYFVRSEAVMKLQEGCGRMQNRLLTFTNGTKSCCRYRQNLDQIQGEIFSFYLSRLLGIPNVPPSTLGVVKTDTAQWERVGNQLALAQWSEEHPVVLTKFVHNLEGVVIPSHLRSSSRRLHPVDIKRYNISEHRNDLIQLAQWSDLLIFDYLTANLDRMVNNLYNLQWNPTMMEAPAHNLAKQTDSKLLIFLDNESGLLHGYRLLDKYEPFHVSLLQSLCVFRKTTAMNIRKLVSNKEVGNKLLKMFKTFEPEIQHFLPTIPEKTILILNERLKRVHKQIMKCKNLYINS